MTQKYKSFIGHGVISNGSEPMRFHVSMTMKVSFRFLLEELNRMTSLKE